MSQSHQDTMPSDSDSDYENEINVHEDEEDWQDAEEQQTTATPREKKEGDQKVKIDEVELRKKIRDIQQDRNLSPKDKAKQIQVSCWDSS
jgi:hypothetical protein